MRRFFPVLALLALSACGSAANAPAPTPQPAAPHSVGQAVTVTGWVITIHSATLRPAMLQAGTALELDISMQNTTTQDSPATLGVGFTLRAPDGTLVEHSDSTNQDLGGPVVAGQTARGLVAWLVAGAGTGTYTLTATSATAVLASWSITV